MNSDYLDTKTMSKVLASSTYQEFCELLFGLFCLSRKAGKDPQKIMEVQEGLMEYLIHLQNEKTRLEKENNSLGVTVAKRLINVVNQIQDSIVWRVLEYDRIAVQLLAKHSKTGALDETIFQDFSIAKQIYEKESVIVLINDLTTILRHGDLTILGKDKIRILETKYGRASRKNRRAKRQRKTLDQLIGFINTGYRFRADKREFLYEVDFPITTYHSDINNAINEAKLVGYSQLILSNCLGIEVTYSNYHEKVEFPKQHLFEYEDNILPFNNMLLFEQTAPGIAPYGIFPLEDRTCFDLIVGNLLITGFLNLENLKKRYENFGLNLEIPDLLDWNAPSSAVEKKNYLESIRFVVNDEERFIGLTLFNLVRICAEFINEDTIIKTNVQLLNLIKELKIPPDRVSSFYIGHKNEKDVWV